MERFKASVIIPVFNAEKYLRNAVQSAIALQEVGEVILIEDASPDNALEVCKQLEEEFQKVKLFRHPNGENRGAGASRNLGIEKVRFDYIAFLDADDWFLPNRFEAEKKLLLEEEVDGVYGATGFFFEETQTATNDLTTITPEVAPENLLYHLLFLKGHFHLDAFTIKKSKLQEAGGFDKNLRLHQDMHLFYKLAFKSKIRAGIINEAVAMRRVHRENRIASANLKSKAKFRASVYAIFKEYEGVEPQIMKKIKKEYLRLKYLRKPYELKHFLEKIIRKS